MKIRELVNNLIASYGIDDVEFPQVFSQHMIDTGWLGEAPVKGELPEDYETRHHADLEEFVMHYRIPERKKADLLMKKAEKTIPDTISRFREYAKENQLHSSVQYHLVDFMMYELPGELALSDDAEVEHLLDTMTDTMMKTYGDIFCDFLNWLNDHYKTAYRKAYFLSSRSKQETDAYAPDEYMKLMYFLYNADYIEENDMYAKAAESRSYVDTWLYLAIHFVCALRTKDLVRIPHPNLPYAPEIVLREIKTNAFAPANAKAVLWSVLSYLRYLPQVPHKTKETSGVASIKLHIPTSAETHIGTLLAAAEAHFRLSEDKKETPLIRPYRSYEQIKKYMGDEIGALFLSSDFRARSANKSYMQLIYLLTDDVLGHEDEFNVKGYLMASLARSHKGGYGSFAETTIRYLKDAKMSGYSAEFVAKELLERGALSFAASTLLKMVIGKDYEDMSVENQTKAIKALDMGGLDIEHSIMLSQKADRNAIQIAKDIYAASSRQDILKVLHRIGNGDAASKIDASLCLITALGKVCPYSDTTNCVGCQYEVGTTSTLFLLVSEYGRLYENYRTSENDYEKNRNKALIQETILPAMDEMLRFVRQEYGEEEYIEISNTIKELSKSV